MTIKYGNSSNKNNFFFDFMSKFNLLESGKNLEIRYNIYYVRKNKKKNLLLN